MRVMIKLAYNHKRIQHVQTHKKVGVIAATLMMLATPATGFAAGANTVISSTISSTITIGTSGTVDLSAHPVNGGVQTQASDSVTVSTNSPTGYVLKLSMTSASATSSLTSGANNVQAVGATQAAPTSLGANTWGYRVDGLSGFGGIATTDLTDGVPNTVLFATVPLNTSPDTLVSKSGTAANDITKVWYGLHADTSLPAGVYANTVTYTAVVN